MEEYPNSDEEFELMYGDELDLLRQQEDPEDIIQGPPAKSRRSLDFSTQSQQASDQESNSQQVNVGRTSSGTPLTTDKSFDSEFELLEQSQTENHVTQNKSQNTSNTTSKKRTIEELFGEIDDILNEEIVNGQVKKRKTDNQSKDDLVLIDHILQLRRLTKERRNPLAQLNKDSGASSRGTKQNISYQVPKYSFMVVTRHDDKRVYVRYHSEEYEKEETQRILKKTGFAGAMGERFKEIWKEAEVHLNKNLDRETDEAHSQNEQTNPADISILKESLTNNTQFWVDLYKPQKYLELLSDESTNRTLLRWLKLWDKVVFSRISKPKIQKSDANHSTFQKQELNMKLDEHGRPELKVALLCGPPGLGKTTLAHMVARHAGYNVVEVNASDDRSIDRFKTILENATQMSSVIDKENRPNCVVFDEIDGAPSSSIEYLIKFVNGAINTKKKKGIKQTAKILKRPIICICNDVYVPALRPLRQIAFVVNFPLTASARLAERLHEIARHQEVKTDLGALLALCEKSGNDIRSCLSVLHFFKSLNKPITLSHVYKTSVGQKDMQKGLFSMWQAIFQIQRPKEIQHNKEEGDANNCMSLKNRMQKILHIVNSFGDYERVAQGVFENYINMNIKDTSLESTCEALEWFCFMDVMSHYISTMQNYTLLSYLPYAFVIWHFVFADLAWRKISYPNAGYEARVKATKNSALLGEVMKGMQPSIRAFAYSSSLKLDVLPILTQIITPAFRPVNLHLYTLQEREQLHHVIHAMIDYNLNYVQERMPEGHYVYNLDPNIDEITSFPETKPKRILSYSSKQLVAREIEVEKMRRTEMHVTKSADITKPKAKGSKQVSPSQLPNHLQRLKPKTVKPKGDGVVTKDFFGRIVTRAANTEKAGVEVKNDIWFQYKEGYNNAVRKRIKISSLI